MSRLKVAVIGCGRISCLHFDAIVESNDATLVACCDSKPERAEACAVKYGGKAYTSVDALLENEQLDAVHLCLPHYLHSQIAEQAFRKGIHVLTEKPMDISYAAARHAVEAAKRAGVQFGVIFQCRYSDAAVAVKSALNAGKLGKIISARSTLTWSRSDDYYSESDWKGTWDLEGGGVIIDQAIHSIDLVNFMVDSAPVEVKCLMANHGHKTVSVEDSAEGLITYANGVKYGFYAMNNYGCDEPIEIRLLCEKGKVVFGYNDAVITYSDGTVEETHEGQKATGGKDYWGSWHAHQIAQFYNALLGREKLEMSGEAALKTHKLIMDIYDAGGMRKK